MGRARRVFRDLLTHTRGMVRNRGMEAPDWLELVERFPPPPVPRCDHNAMRKLVFPQDRLAELYTNRSGFPADDETAYEFADEQLTLIEHGVPEKQAYEMLMEKYEKVESERFLQKFANARDKPFVSSEDADELLKQWMNDEADAVKQAMRMEFEEAQELAKDDQ